MLSDDFIVAINAIEYNQSCYPETYNEFKDRLDKMRADMLELIEDFVE